MVAEAKFGMFIHFGLFSEAGGYWQGKPVGNMGEWMMKIAHIPVADYATLATRFNPVKFNADRWVGLAKATGMKYIVITAKHHEGFAMYHTKLEQVQRRRRPPFHRDVIKEMSQACAGRASSSASTIRRIRIGTMPAAAWRAPRFGIRARRR